MKAHPHSVSQRLQRGQPPSYERLQAMCAEDGMPLSDSPRPLHCGWAAC